MHCFVRALHPAVERCCHCLLGPSLLNRARSELGCAVLDRCFHACGGSVTFPMCIAFVIPDRKRPDSGAQACCASRAMLCPVHAAVDHCLAVGMSQP